MKPLKTPQYMDDLILTHRRGSDDVTGLAAGHNALQSKRRLANEVRGRSLGLSKQRLEDRRSHLNHLSGQRDISNLAAIGGLGFSMYESDRQKQKDSQIEQVLNGLTEFFQGLG